VAAAEAGTMLQVATAVAEMARAVEQRMTDAPFPAETTFVDVKVTVPVGTPGEVLVTVTEKSSC